MLIWGSSSFGYDSAFIGVTIARTGFKNDFGIAASEANSISSNITSTFQAGAFFGALFCFFCKLVIPHEIYDAAVLGRMELTVRTVTELYGRKKATGFSVLIFLIGAILMTAATHQLSFICKDFLTPRLSVGRVTD